MNFKKPNKIFVKNRAIKEADKEVRCTRLEELFSRNREAFVIKKNKATGELIGKVAYCALSPV